MNRKKLVIILICIFAALLAGAAGIYFVLNPSAPVLIDGYTPETKIICIDAGHGGSDPGAVNGERQEKDDNLTLALLVARELEALGYTPLLTRSDDSYLTLGDRCEIANEQNAAYFVSLHRNSASESAKGVEVWISSKKTAAERKLAQKIMDALTEVGVQSERGVKAGTQASTESDYSVNKNTKMPSCIIELGFITNGEDNRLLDENMEEYASAIARAIAEVME